MTTKQILIVLFFVSSGFTIKAQQIGDGWAPVIPNFGAILQSGAYNGYKALGSVPDNSNDGWQHLFVIRHPNVNNNHQFQLGTSFAENDRLFFRKITSGLTPRSPDWIELATRGSNSFVGNQNINGNVGVGTASPTAGLHVATYYNSNNIKIAAILGNEYDSWTNFGGLTAGRIRGSNEGYLCVGSNPGGSGDKNLYLNYDSPGNVLIANGGGYVGIGMNFPKAKLDVNVLHAWNQNEAIRIGSNTSGSDYYGIGLNYRLDGAGNPTGHLVAYEGNTSFDALSINLYHQRVGIGTTAPDSKLTVKGTIHAEEVKVDLNIPAADYVFESDYALMPLSEVKQFVEEKKHLPGIPSGKEMEANGINVSEMNMLLLKKVEELTLHIIRQEKEIEELKSQFKTIQKQ